MSNLREGWNFHNDIAISLERDARRILKLSERPYGTIFDANAIEGGTFVEVMIDLMRTKTENADSSEIDSFINQYSCHIGKSGHDIGDEEAEEIYDKFCSYIN